jgi:hypothetical protein
MTREKAPPRERDARSLPPAGSPRPPHPATVVQRRASLAPAIAARPPHTATVGLRAEGATDARVAQRMKRDEPPSVFVVGPTRDSYDEENELDVKKCLGKLTDSVMFDIAYLKNCKRPVCEQVFFSGAPESGLGAIVEMCSELSESAPITIVFSAHGSPGPNGRIGMGKHELGEESPNYRLTAKELVVQLCESPLMKLANRDVTFEFRCCNSGYVPFTNPYVVNATEHGGKVLDRSYIGTFRTELKKVWEGKLTVVGFRGFYHPDKKNPKVETKGDKKAIEVGTITILPNDTVVLSPTIKLLKNNDTLAGFFT